MKSYIYVASVVGIIAVGILTYKFVSFSIPDGVKSKESTQLSKMKQKLKKVTTVKEKPDGSKDTTIVEELDIVNTKPVIRKHRLDATIKRSYDRLLEQPNVYEATYSYRVFENIWFGLGVGSDKTVHIRTGVEF
jgi:hypothetical protein